MYDEIEIRKWSEKVSKRSGAVDWEQDANEDKEEETQYHRVVLN